MMLSEISGGVDNNLSIPSYSDSELEELKRDVFWRTKKTKQGNSIDISLYRLCSFLKRKGFGRYDTGQERTEKDYLVRWNNKVLQKYNIKSIKNFIIEYFEKSNPELFKSNNPYCVEYDDDEGTWFWSKENVLDRLLRNNFFNEQSIPALNDFDSESPKLFLDEEDVVYIRFKDRLVKVTADEIEESDYSVLGDESVWETQLISKPFIGIDENPDEGLFEKYMKQTCYDISESVTDNWRDGFTFNSERWKSLKTTYGYMISQYKNPELTKCVIFVDKDTSEGSSNGRTGKSVIMNSMTHWKAMEKENGKDREVIKGNHRLSQIKLDTKFCHIQDLYNGFEFQDMFNPVADDLDINPKNNPRFTIPYEHSPKFGITTNFLSTDTDVSIKDRQHFVEFGGYWRVAKLNGEQPSHKNQLGKMLFGREFTDKDWNDFYNFGFRCVQEYLKDGLIECSMDDMGIKIAEMSILKDGGKEGMYEWILNWIENDRVNQGADKIPGIDISDLMDDFNKSFCDHIMMMGGKSYIDNFKRHIYDVCEAEGYVYNKHKSHKGNTPSARRYQKMINGKMKDYLVVTPKQTNPVSISNSNDNNQGNQETNRNDEIKSSPDKSNDMWEGYFD